MARYCGYCGAPLGTADRCPNCGWVAQPAPAQDRKRPLIPVLIIGGAALLLVLAVILAVSLSGGGQPRTGNNVSPGGAGTADEAATIEPLERPDDEEALSVYGSIDARENAASAALLTEAEAVQAFAARGFTNVEITTCYGVNGDYLGKQTVSASGTEKHPYYEAGYVTPDNIPWVVTLAGTEFYATPVSYNSEGDWYTLHMLSETGTIRTYGSQTNTFYIITPDSDGLFLKQVARIDTATLDVLNSWEVDAP